MSGLIFMHRRLWTRLCQVAGISEEKALIHMQQAELFFDIYDHPSHCFATVAGNDTQVAVWWQRVDYNRLRPVTASMIGLIDGENQMSAARMFADVWPEGWLTSSDLKERADPGQIEPGARVMVFYKSTRAVTLATMQQVGGKKDLQPVDASTGEVITSYKRATVINAREEGFDIVVAKGRSMFPHYLQARTALWNAQRAFEKPSKKTLENEHKERVRVSLQKEGVRRPPLTYAAGAKRTRDEIEKNEAARK